MTDPLVGTQLDEYFLEDLLGHGGMARVYRGLDTGLERYAAVKVIDTPYQQDEDYIARFEKEARAIAQLDHPHIVTVYRYGGSGQMLYLAMKYVEGVDLNAVLNGYEADKQFMPDVEVIRLLREIGSALDYAHSQGVIHRDIKPSNIMLDPNGRAYLTDFGLALLTEVGTRGEILGSPQYIAPEQAVSSAGAVAQSDLYALGVILYRMVTGTIPFDDEDVLELLMLHMTVPPPSPSTIRPEISPAVEAVLLKALAKEPVDRYQSGEDLAEAYAEALANETAVPLATLVPTLTIMDRVALDMEALPPPGYVEPQLTTEPLPPVPPLPATQSASEPEPSEIPPLESGRGERKVWPIAVVVGVLLLLCLAFFLLRGGLGDEEAMAVGDAPMATATVETSAEIVDEVETPIVENEESDLVETAVDTEIDGAYTEAPKTEDSTPSSGDTSSAPSSSETVYIPVVNNEGNQEELSTAFPEEVAPTAPAEALIPTPTTAPLIDTPTPVSYQLLIAMNKEDSLFVVNQANEDFPLNRLSLGNDDGAIQGSEWGLGQLPPDACVTAWKDGGKPKAPDVECNQVGERLERGKSDRFWKKEFFVFFDGEELVKCKPKNPCLIEFSP